ncbi:MAG: 3-dehydroquinate synthase, partial [Dehalococcoidia bacterium]
MTDPSLLPRRIVLIGLSGSGKSSVARLVARQLGWSWGDSDDQVVSHDGRHIPQIFRDEGEEHFRRLERQVIAQLVRGTQTVIATGGGAVLLPENRQRLWHDAFVVRLRAEPELLLGRVTNGTRAGEARPLLTGPDPLARLQDLARNRESFYALADWTIQTDELSPADVAQEVVRAYRARGAVAGSRAGRMDAVTVTAGSMPRGASHDRDVAATVQTPSGNYPVVVGWDTLPTLGPRLQALGLAGRASVISDDRVASLHGERLLRLLREAGFEVELYRLRSGEQYKTLHEASAVYDWLISRRAERGESIIALGGGVVTDLGGFVAATYLRGVPLVHLPTSLLGAVDAAIGGKTAVDHPRGKNLIGAFYQPRLVLIDGALLTSLPRRELISGWAEVIKHGLIMDEGLVQYLEAQVEPVSSLAPAETITVLRHSVQLKASIVSADEREAGLRSTLNYGHTIGHALEAATDYGRYLHGEAVAIGMAGAGELSRRLGLLSDVDLQRQNALLAAYGLPLTWSGADIETVIGAMAADKKVSGGSVKWVLLEGPG